MNSDLVDIVSSYNYRASPVDEGDQQFDVKTISINIPDASQMQN